MSEQMGTSIVGLDVGTSRIVAARRSGGSAEYGSQLNAFVSIPYSKMTENSLHRESVGHQIQGDTIVIHGNEAPRFADLLNLEMRRPMTQGLMNPAEIESVPVIRQIIESLVQSECGPPKVCFSVPAAPLNAEDSLTYHDATLRQIFSDLKYEVRSVNEGMAVVYSELEDTNFTGVGISCGGGLCNVALSYLSMPAMSFSVPKAGDYIDASVAGVTGDLANRIRIAKEQSFCFNGHFAGKLQQVLTVYYDDMIGSLIAAMQEAFSNSRRMPKLKRPVPIVLSGGTASPKGFRDRFEKQLRASDLPIEISEIRLARDPLTTTANGALVAGLAEM
ncbi:MAG: hypothetical protein JJE04_25080 [Acidobacteriia bacterium]|nr:hypothetical protein [Terriglobia bacterium]